MQKSVTRRQLIETAGKTAAVTGAVALAGDLALPATAQVQPAEAPPQPRQPAQPQSPPPLPMLDAPTEQKTPPPPAPLPPRQRVGYALVGLGTLTMQEILPALSQTEKSRVTALVTGDRAKGLQVARQYGVPERAIYTYAEYDRIRDNPEVDAVYIVLPNSMHEEYTVRGAQAGKHILCEKPMATSVRECENMIAACKKADRKLMIAYRIQYEPHNREVRRMLRAGEYGKVKIVEGWNGQNQGDPNQWRQKKKLAGGGSLPDVGLYCLNTTRFLLGEEPIEIMGTTYSTPGDPRFVEVEENCIWQMRFPSGVQANLGTGYGHHITRRYRVLAERGWVQMDPAFAYNGLRMETAHAEGPKEIISQVSLGAANQFAKEIDHMSDCVLNNKTPFTPGEEGLQDHRLMEAIYESARTGRVVKFAKVDKMDAFRGPEPVEKS